MNRWDTVREIFHIALEKPEAEREAFLREAAPDDPALRDEVMSLLAAHEATGNPFDRPLGAHLHLDETLEGLRVGPWELVRHIGAGGMGSVYEAVRADEQFRMRAAVKLLRPGLMGELAIRRFRRERQILADLEHDNIAQLLDGGVTDDGYPYLVMEYVDGAPITKFCDERRLGIRARVQLFLQVCDAVRHAHQRLVIHRDLKPGNILVTNDGIVKLLDFGIAKLLRGEDSDEPVTLTATGLRALTPEYASPEQIRGRPVGTPSDVYSLGTVLFELLAGRRPLALADLSLAEIERAVTQTPPSRPGAVVDDAAAAARGERSAARLRGRLAGDLEAIVLMALRKEPERRYGSVEALANDLGHWLDGLPVSARPDSVGYRLGKFVKRRRLELASAAIVLVTLVGGMIATSRQAARAENERARTEAINDFLLSMLGAADPGSLGPDATVREVLDGAAVTADELRDQPPLEAEVRVAIGRTYVGLGDYATARTHFTRALDIHRTATRDRRAEALALSNVAGSWEFDGEYATADSLHQAALTLFLDVAPAADPELGNMYDDAARSRHNMGDLDDAERLQRLAIDARSRINGPDDPALVFSWNNLAVLMGDRGDVDAADSLHQLTIALARRIHGERHPVVATALNNYAGILERKNDLAGADSVLRVVIDLRRDLLGPEHPDYAWTLFNHAQLLAKREHWPEAARRAREVLALRGKTLPDAHPAVNTAMQALGVALANQDSLAQGIAWLEQSVALRHEHFPPGHWLIASGEGVLGEYLGRMGRFEEAEQLLIGSEKVILEQLGAQAMQVRDARSRLVRLYEAWQRPGPAGEWRARLEQVEGS